MWAAQALQATQTGTPGGSRTHFRSITRALQPITVALQVDRRALQANAQALQVTRHSLQADRTGTSTDHAPTPGRPAGALGRSAGAPGRRAGTPGRSRTHSRWVTQSLQIHHPRTPKAALYLPKVRRAPAKPRRCTGPRCTVHPPTLVAHRPKAALYPPKVNRAPTQASARRNGRGQLQNLGVEHADQLRRHRGLRRLIQRSRCFRVGGCDDVVVAEQSGACERL
jgi:hypothetical protein